MRQNRLVSSGRRVGSKLALAQMFFMTCHEASGWPMIPRLVFPPSVKDFGRYERESDRSRMAHRAESPTMEPLSDVYGLLPVSLVGGFAGGAIAHTSTKMAMSDLSRVI